MDSGLWISKAVSIVLILLTTLVGVIIGLKVFKDSKGKDSLLLHISICFTSSVFISVAFIHLLPDSIDAFQDSGVRLNKNGSDHAAYQLLFTSACFGVIVAELVEYYSKTKGIGHHGSVERRSSIPMESIPRQHSMEEQGGSNDQQQKSIKTIPLVMVTLLSFHSFIAGLALGASSSTSSVILVLIAIVAHKWAEALAICYEFEVHDIDRDESLRMLGIYSCMTPVGIIIAALTTGFLEDEQLELVIQSVIISFTTGVFLFAGLGHLSHADMYRGEHRLLYRALSLFAGLALMLTVSFWA